MNSDRPEERTARTRLEELYFAALDLPTAEREAFVRHECGGDGELCGRVLGLLDPGPERPLRFGHYRVTGRIGIGGMGVVYAAVRDDAEFDKRVAVKAIPAGLMTAHTAQALRHERQILAQLEHPNIARLLDGGTTPEGIPYIVLEYVEGVPIAQYVEQEKLTQDARLRLFLDVCDGVAYAHRQLVIHRDLKPSNILVTPEGVPKLLDFGIAKLLGPDSEVTAAAERAMTLDYASPEQLNGARMTTASDLYSLALVLYLLLTGRHPFQTTDAETGEVSRNLLNREHLEARDLPAELFSILSMALRTDPAERYQSVERFEEDIRSYLAGRPVMAVRQTALYRARKFVRRNATVLLALVIVCVAVIAGVEFRIAQLQTAQRRYNDIRRVAKSFAFEIPDAIESLPGTLAARQLIVKRATEYLSSLSAEERRDPVLQAELAAAYNRIGSLTFDVATSLDLHRKALAIDESLSRADPGNRAVQQELSNSYGLVANTLRQMGDSAGAVENYRKATAIMESLAASQPGNKDSQFYLSDCDHWMGTSLSRIGQMDEALVFYEKARAIRERLSAAEPENRLYRHFLMVTYAMAAQVLSNQGRHGEAKAYAEKALGMAEALDQLQPANTMYRRDLWLTHFRLGFVLYRAGETSRSLNEYRAAREYIMELAQADPGDKGHQRWAAVTDLFLGDAEEAAGLHAAAEREYASGIARAEELARFDPEKAENRLDMARLYAHLGALHARRGRAAEAHRLLGKAQELYTSLVRQDPHDAELRADAAECTQEISRLQ